MREFQRGETILNEGDPPNEILEMVDGKATVLHGNRYMGSITTGEIFGEIGFLTDKRRTATVIAEKRCILRVVSKEDFLALAQSNANLGLALSRNLANRIVPLNGKLAVTPK